MVTALDSTHCPTGQMLDDFTHECKSAAELTTVTPTLFDEQTTGFANGANIASSNIASDTAKRAYLQSVFVDSGLLQTIHKLNAAAHDMKQRLMRTHTSGTEAQVYGPLLRKYYAIYQGYHYRRELLKQFGKLAPHDISRCATLLAGAQGATDAELTSCEQTFENLLENLDSALPQVPTLQPEQIHHYRLQLAIAAGYSRAESIRLAPDPNSGRLLTDGAIVGQRAQTAIATIAALHQEVMHDLIAAQSMYPMIHMPVRITQPDGSFYEYSVGQYASFAIEVMQAHINRFGENEGWSKGLTSRSFVEFVVAVDQAVTNTIANNEYVLTKALGLNWEAAFRTGRLRESLQWPAADAWMVATAAHARNAVPAGMTSTQQALLQEMEQSGQVSTPGLLAAGAACVIGVAGGILLGGVTAIAVSGVLCLGLSAIGVHEMVALSEISAAAYTMTFVGIEHALEPPDSFLDKQFHTSVAALMVMVDVAAMGVDGVFLIRHWKGTTSVVSDLATAQAKWLGRVSRIRTTWESSADAITTWISRLRSARRSIPRLNVLQLPELRAGGYLDYFTRPRWSEVRLWLRGSIPFSNEIEPEPAIRTWIELSSARTEVHGEMVKSLWEPLADADFESTVQLLLRSDMAQLRSAFLGPFANDQQVVRALAANLLSVLNHTRKSGIAYGAHPIQLVQYLLEFSKNVPEEILRLAVRLALSHDIIEETVRGYSLGKADTVFMKYLRDLGISPTDNIGATRALRGYLDELLGDDLGTATVKVMEPELRGEQWDTISGAISQEFLHGGLVEKDVSTVAAFAAMLQGQQDDALLLVEFADRLDNWRDIRYMFPSGREADQVLMRVAAGYAKLLVFLTNLDPRFVYRAIPNGGTIVGKDIVDLGAASYLAPLAQRLLDVAQQQIFFDQRIMIQLLAIRPYMQALVDVEVFFRIVDGQNAELLLLDNWIRRAYQQMSGGAKLPQVQDVVQDYLQEVLH